MFQLVVERGYERGSVFTLKEGDNQVGRALTCPIQLKAADVSRTHMVIRVNGPDAEAEKLSSRAACQLDGVPLEGPVPLKDGQRFTLGGSTILRFVRMEEEEPAEAGADDLDEQPTRPAPLGLSVPSSEPAPVQPSEVRLQNPEPNNKAILSAAGATQPIPEVNDENIAGDFLISRAEEDEAGADDDGPVSGFVDFQARPEPSGDDSFGPPSMIVSPPGSLLKRDTAFDPDDGPVSMIINRPIPIPSERDPGEEESDGPHTRGLSHEAMEYIRKRQLRKARTRLAIIVGGCILLLVLLAILIMNM